jgi:C-terminal processing protease CtpA/Prc
MARRVSIAAAVALLSIALLAPLAQAGGCCLAASAGINAAYRAAAPAVAKACGRAVNAAVAAAGEMLEQAGSEKGAVKVLVRDDEGNVDIFLSSNDGGGWLGVHVQDLDEDLREAMELDDDVEGVVVSDVVDDSPAEKFGIEDGDLIISVDGDEMTDVSELVEKIRSYDPDTEVDVAVLRNGRKKVMGVVLGQRSKQVLTEDFLWKGKDLEFPPIEIGAFGFGGKGRLGVYVDDLSEGLAEYFDVPDGEGALVEDVVEDSPAEEAGIQAGDVIIKVGDHDVDDTDSLIKAIDKMEADEETPVEVLRRGRKLTLNATVGESPYEKFVQKIKEIKIKHDEDHPDRRVIMIGEDDEELDSELDKLREELKQMKKELEKLRKELKSSE